MSATISSIYRYPVKGLSPQSLERADLAPGRILAGDRRFALALASTRFDGQAPEWQAKSAFLTLLKHDKLAALETVFNDAGTELTIRRNGKQVARGNLAEPLGRAMIEDFFTAYLGGNTHGKPRLVDAGADVTFTDQKDKLVSIINLASIRDLERITGAELDPVRFRANIYIDGIEPWCEFQWIGGDVAVGGAILSVREKIGRCVAINVNPENGTRDQNLVKALRRGFGHTDMGIFATVTQGGEIAVGAAVG